MKIILLVSLVIFLKYDLMKVKKLINMESEDDLKSFFDDFLKFEKDMNLFSITYDDFSVWDIVRYAIFTYLYEYNGTSTTKEQVFHRINYLRKLRSLPLVLFSVLKTHLKLRKCDNLLFSSSRKKINGRYEDTITYDFKQIMTDKYVELECNASNKRYDSFAFHKKLFNTISSREIIDFSGIIDEMSNLVSLHFGVPKDSCCKVMNSELNRFTDDRKYYLYIFNKIKPKRVFLLQDGIQKGLIYACKKLSIELSEFQHGIINRFHQAYSYSRDIDYTNLKTVPDNLLTFSDYWGKGFYMPTTKIIPLGNSFYNYPRLKDKKGKHILIISTIPHQELFNEELSSFSENVTPIVIKLHPSQSLDYKRIKEHYKNSGNISVIYDEFSTEDLLKEASKVVVIRSTVTYEALQLGIPVYILKRRDYIGHSDLFDIGGVSVVDSFLEVVNGKTPTVENVVFFDTFNPAALKSLL